MSKMEAIHIGFTGSRNGLTLSQRQQILEMLATYTDKPMFIHHGDCVGSDADFHSMCQNAATIIIHPPINSKCRAFCNGNITRDEKEYIQRNHDIVNECDILIACPSGEEIPRSGTWATIRYARKINKPMIIIK